MKKILAWREARRMRRMQNWTSHLTENEKKAAHEVGDLIARVEYIEAIRGAWIALQDQLEWTENQHADTGSWHVTVTMPGCPVFGNDGHLLSTDVDECRYIAFVSLLQCIAAEDDGWR